MPDGVTIAHLELGSPERFVSLRRPLGIEAFGMNLMLLRPGERGRIHRHERQEEVYLVIEGTLTLAVEGVETDLAEGVVARVAPEVRRQLLNRGPGRCAVVALGGAGAPHQGRDGLAYDGWDDDDPRPPQEVPLPEDLPPGELRG